MGGSPTWFPMDSAGGVKHYDSTMRETEGAELGLLNSASRGLSDTQRLCQTTQLAGCSTCAAFQPLHRNHIAQELGESEQARDVLTT